MLNSAYGLCSHCNTHEAHDARSASQEAYEKNSVRFTPHIYLYDYSGSPLALCPEQPAALALRDTKGEDSLPPVATASITALPTAEHCCFMEVALCHHPC